MTCPCKDCEHRSPACHGQCEVYKAWRSPVDVMRKDKERQRMIDEVYHDGSKRRNRRWNRDHKK